MPTFQENIIGGGTKQFEWDRNRPPKRGRERAAEAFKDMKHGGSVKKYAKGGGVRKARYK